MYIAHDHLGRAERRLESVILICALLQLFSWVSGRLNALMSESEPPNGGGYESSPSRSSLSGDDDDSTASESSVGLSI